MQTIKQVAAQTKKMGDRSTLKGTQAKIYHHLSPVEKTPFVGDGWEDVCVVTGFGTEFRVFKNRKTFELLSYLQGDWRLVQCSDEASYRKEVAELRKINGMKMH